MADATTSTSSKSNSLIHHPSNHRGGWNAAIFIICEFLFPHFPFLIPSLHTQTLTQTPCTYFTSNLNFPKLFSLPTIPSSSENNKKWIQTHINLWNQITHSHTLTHKHTHTNTFSLSSSSSSQVWSWWFHSCGVCWEICVPRIGEQPYPVPDKCSERTHHASSERCEHMGGSFFPLPSAWRFHSWFLSGSLQHHCLVLAHLSCGK